jgi:hypothetical protein
MPLSPPLMLEARNDTKFHLLPQFDIVGPSLGLTRNLGARKKEFITWEFKLAFDSLQRPISTSS